MLANQIALATLAVMLGAEATRAQAPWNRGLWTLATVVALFALALRPIAARLPSAEAIVSDVFGSRVAWFVLAMGLFLVLRPFWAKQPVASRPTRARRLSNLQARGWLITERIRHDRNLKWFQRDHSEELLDVTRDGMSLLLDYANEGLPIPEFAGITSAERVCFGLEHYFSALRPFMRDGHIGQVDAMAKSVAERAYVVAVAFNPENWHVDRYGR